MISIPSPSDCKQESYRIYGLWSVYVWYGMKTGGNGALFPFCLSWEQHANFNWAPPLTERHSALGVNKLGEPFWMASVSWTSRLSRSVRLETLLVVGSPWLS